MELSPSEYLAYAISFLACVGLFAVLVWTVAL